MAIIKIGKVKVTPDKAINYAVSDKKSLHKKDDVKDSQDYVTKDKTDGSIIYKTLNTAMFCSIKNAHKEWKSVRANFGKDDKILMFHVKQNFGLNLEPEVAHEIGCKLAKELFSDYQCIVSTHTNTKYTHNHIIFNSVSFKNGKKYYDTLGSYKKMRKVSDRLCKEYGLPVLNETKDFKLVKFTGSDGKIKYYEPTKRKNEARKGEFSNRNDYRNTDTYKRSETYKLSNREVIKKDIDELLPIVNSYDELLRKLKSIGYDVRSKKVNGDWLKNVSFKAPTQQKFTRDHRIGDNYIREYLTEIINKRYMSIETENNVMNNKSNDVKTNDNIRTNNIEKLIISDTKKINTELESKYWDATKIIRDKKQSVLKNKRNQYLLDCINANLKTLRFVEQKNIQSFKQISTVVNLLYDKRNQVQIQLNKVKVLLKKANESVTLIEKYKELERHIELVKKDSNFNVYELEEDKNLLKTYNEILSKKNLLDVKQQEIFINKVNRFNDNFHSLVNNLKLINKQIIEYDDCVYTIKRIDKDGLKQYEKEIEQYYTLKKGHTIQNNKINKNRDER